MAGLGTAVAEQLLPVNVTFSWYQVIKIEAMYVRSYLPRCWVVGVGALAGPSWTLYGLNSGGREKHTISGRKCATRFPL